MSRKAKKKIAEYLQQNGRKVPEEELNNYLVAEQGITEQTARDYITMYCTRDKTGDVVQVFDPDNPPVQSAESISTSGVTESGHVMEVGAPSKEKFSELTVLADVGHPKVPSADYEDGYYRRRVQGRKTDVQVVTRALDRGHNVMLIGETGVGKGELVKHIAANTNRPVYQANMGEDVRVDDLIGHYELVDGETEWVDGILTKCVREGGIFLADEFNAAGGAVTIQLHAVTEDDPTLTVPQTGEVIKPHPQFRVVGTMNPNYAGTKQQNWASMNRFFPVELGYLDEQREVQVILDSTELDESRRSDIESLVQAANELRQDYKQGVIITPIGTRELIKVADFIEDDWMSLEAAAKLVLGNLAHSDDQSAVEKVLEVQL